MATLVVRQDPFDRNPVYYELPVGVNLAEWMMSNLLRPEGNFAVYRGSVALSSLMRVEDVDISVEENDLFHALYVPAGPDAWGWILIGSLVLSVAAAVLLRPEIPDTDQGFDNEEGSPNNRVSGQTNEIRTGSRVPDILGKVRSFPDLLAPSYSIWDGTQQDVVEYFCIGMGEYELEKAALGDTLIDSLTNASVDFYGPNLEATRPDELLAVIESPQVNSLPLLAPNEVVEGDVTNVAFNSTLSQITFIDGHPGSDVRSLRVGDIFTLTNQSGNSSVNFGGYEVASNVSPVNDWDSNQNYEPSSDQAIYTVKKLDGGDAPVLATESGQDMVFRLYDIVKEVTWRVQSVQGSKITLSSNSPRLFAKYGDVAFFRDNDPQGNNRPGFITAWKKLPEAYTWSAEFGGIGGIKGYQWRRLNGADPGWGSASSGQVQVALLDTADAGDLNRVGPFVTPGEDPDQIWVDIQFPQGHYQQWTGSESIPPQRKKTTTTEYEITIQPLNDIGDGSIEGDPWVITQTRNFKALEAAQFTERYYIDDLVADGPSAVPPINFLRRKKYNVSVRRTDNRYEDAPGTYKVYVDEVKLASIRSAFIIQDQTFADGVTTALVHLSASSAIASLEDRTFNVMATRRLPDYSNPQYANQPLRPTRSWADGFVYRALAEDGGRSAYTDVDISAIYAIQSTLDAMDNGEGGYMDATLDRLQDVDTELAQLADVARCIAYRVGRKIYVARDEENTNFPSSLYNRRNKSNRAETLTISFDDPDGYDGIEFTYTEPDIGYKSFTFTFPLDEEPPNPKRIEGFGISTWSKAYRRAAYEYQKIVYRRDDLQLEVLEDPRLLAPFMKIRNVNNIDLANQIDGEILSYDSSSRSVKLDREVLIPANTVYVIWLRDPEQQILQTRLVVPYPLGDFWKSDTLTDQLQLSSSPTITLRGRSSLEGGVGTLYTLATQNDDPSFATDYIILGYENTQEGYAQISATRYQEEVYEYDTGDVGTRPDLPE